MAAARRSWRIASPGGRAAGCCRGPPGRALRGAAGRLLDQALSQAGIGREDAYVTNAVKLLRWKPDPRGGKRRIHERPDALQLRACRTWLDAELVRLSPRVIVTLAATAGPALCGSSFRVGAHRGELVSWPAPAHGGGVRDIDVVPTIHPSAVLRADDRDAALKGLVADLQAAARAQRAEG
jgi:uracil-DNA glycosylase family 4